MDAVVIKPHTIIITVGPSCCGKSTWAESMISQAHRQGVRGVRAISSDSIRASLAPEEASNDYRSNATYLALSEAAFDLLFAQLKAYTAYPVNSELIVVDTTGMDEQFRSKVREIGVDNGYHVVIALFDYSRGDLEKIGSHVPTYNGYVTGKHHKRLREEVLPNLNRKMYQQIIKFNKPEQTKQFRVNFDVDLIRRCEFVVGNHDRVAVIGDVHECVTELEQLTSKLINQGVNHFVFCGDWIDKGDRTKDTIEFLNKFADPQSGRQVRFVLGNHERYVFRRLRGEIEPQPEVESMYFSGVANLEQDTVMRFAGEAIYMVSTPFVLIRSADWTRRPIYVTHAPCRNNLIGKISEQAVREQCNIYFKERGNLQMQKDLAFVDQQARSNFPWHVFGHVAHADNSPRMMKNEIWLDTGCVHGGALSAVVFGEYPKPDFVVVNAINRKIEDRYKFPSRSKVDNLATIDIQLSEEDERRASWVAKSGVKYISGTMSPAAALGDDIESIDAAVDYFIKAGVKDVVVEPKYMGSRAQFYLVKDDAGQLDLDKCFATSRNGFKIKHDLSEKYRELFAKYDQLFKHEIIIDSELCPWHVLGSQLIEETFMPYQAAIAYQLDILKQDNEFAKFGLDIDPVDKSKQLDEFGHQLDIYGQSGETTVMPFNIIAIDGQWYGDQDQWVVFNDMLKAEGGLAIDLSVESDIIKLREHFHAITVDQMMEGIVIKPRTYTDGCVPYMKVRNKKYLRLIYGYDYTDRNERLCRQKSTKSKSRISIEEYQLGRIMIEQPELRTKAIYAMFGAIAKERDLDPRL